MCILQQIVSKIKFRRSSNPDTIADSAALVLKGLKVGHSPGHHIASS